MIARPVIVASDLALITQVAEPGTLKILSLLSRLAISASLGLARGVGETIIRAAIPKQ